MCVWWWGGGGETVITRQCQTECCNIRSCCCCSPASPSRELGGGGGAIKGGETGGGGGLGKASAPCSSAYQGRSVRTAVLKASELKQTGGGWGGVRTNTVSCPHQQVCVCGGGGVEGEHKRVEGGTQQYPVCVCGRGG